MQTYHDHNHHLLIIVKVADDFYQGIWKASAGSDVAQLFIHLYKYYNPHQHHFKDLVSNCQN